jgi:arsenate-mycothiol transferase
MAAGLMRQTAGDTVHVYSAGTQPGAAINALSAQSLGQIGVDIQNDIRMTSRTGR